MNNPTVNPEKPRFRGALDRVGLESHVTSSPGGRDSGVPAHHQILFLGNDWWGSDARALGAALRREGHCLIEVQDVDYLPSHWSSFLLKVVRKLVSESMAANFNTEVLRHATATPIGFVLVFKGKLLRAETIRRLKALGLPVYCVYPDVSFLDHGRAIWQCLPLYDCVFTTKSFHLLDPRIVGRTRALRLVSHGYDPEVHRPLPLSESTRAGYACDVSFVGCWSAKKEALLRALVERCRAARIRIWGEGWHRAAAPVRARWAGRGAYGDELAIVHAASRINLGLLSKAGTGTAVGDQITVRSWQIPACGGFMLHEHTDEIAGVFDVQKEIATFRSSDELVQQVERFLADEPERERRRAAGYAKCQTSDFTYGPMAKAILQFHEETGGAVRQSNELSHETR